MEQRRPTACSVGSTTTKRTTGSCFVASAVVLFLLAACGDPSGSADDAVPLVPGATFPPATALMEPPATGSIPTLSLVPNEVTEPCPESADLSNAGAEMTVEAGRLEPTLGQALAYGSQHADEFGAHGLIWHDNDDASVFVSFTGNLEQHRDMLAEIVEHPDELIVCQVAVAGDVANTLQAELSAELAGRFLSISRGRGAIEVTLKADDEELAGELHERYGHAIELAVGVLAYPLDEAASVCEAPPASAQIDGLTLEVVPPDEAVVAPGVEAPALLVTATNVGDQHISFTSGIATGTILGEAGNVVSGSVGALPSIGIPVELVPGESTEIPLAVSTASCDPTLGYVVPPGEYLLTATVWHPDGPLTAVPAPITVSS